MDFKLIAFDLDGTVYQKGTYVTQGLKDILLRLESCGIKLVSSTGRHHCEYAPWINEVKIMSAPAIICSGAAIYDYRKDMSLRKIALDSEKMSCAAHIFDKYNRSYMSFTEFEFISNFGSEMTDEVLWCNERCPAGKKIKITFTPDAAELIKNTSGIVKQSVLLDGKEPESFYDELRGIEGISFLRMGSPIMEISEKKVNKGEALSWLCEDFGIDMKDVLVFGDGETDIPMFEVAGKSIAMGNASDHVKSRADQVADRFDNDGVEKMLKQIYKSL